MTRIFLESSHAYPGCRARLPDKLPPDEADITVSFSDGTDVPARLFPSAEGPRVEIARYRTAAGSVIPRKTWLLGRDDAGWKVRARVDCA
ncbi:MAG: hypothetical protein QM682_00745 [Paracoccus sp. (in: a-proteobacteria)]|uniref:hypothetical protein n=1 Tax=Paracoccus sp. TaxID=267 RepID=UPI0039E54879